MNTFYFKFNKTCELRSTTILQLQQMVINKKKRTTRTNDSQLGLGPGLKRKKMKVPATIALTVWIVTLTILGACAHATSPLLHAIKRKNELKIRAEKRNLVCGHLGKEKMHVSQIECFTDYSECTEPVLSTYAKR